MDVMQARRKLLMSMIGGKIQMVEMGTYTPSEDIYAYRAHITHGLGAVPDFVIVIADAFVASTDLASRYIANAYSAKANLVASNKNANGFSAYQGNYPNRDIVWASNETINYTKFMNENYFDVPYYNTSDMLKAGVTYHYVVGKFE